jgi:hypothetical protein
MFCPQCQAEYLPHVRRCSDCDVPLVEHLPVTDGDFERRQRSRFVVFKELGLFIVLPILFLATMLDFVALRENQFGIQTASIIGDTGFVFLLVFCDTRGWKGYSLGEKAVRQKLPMLLCPRRVSCSRLCWGHGGDFDTPPLVAFLDSRKGCPAPFVLARKGPPYLLFRVSSRFLLALASYLLKRLFAEEFQGAP